MYVIRTIFNIPCPVLQPAIIILAHSGQQSITGGDGRRQL
jgi:hypothetical protein